MATKRKLAVVAVVIVALGIYFAAPPGDRPGPGDAPAPPVGGEHPDRPEGGGEPGTGADSDPGDAAAPPSELSENAGSTGTGEPPPTKKIEGVVLDGEGRPVRDARVEIQDVRTIGLWIGWQTPGSHSTVTDAEGRFQMPVLSGDNYTVTVSAAGFAKTTVTANAGGPAVRFELEPGFTVSGRVVGADTRLGIPNMPIYFEPELPAGSKGIGATCDKEGRFLIAGARRGSYTVRAGAQFVTGREAWEEYIMVKAGPFEAEVTEVEIEVVRGLSIEGTALDSTGKGLAAGNRLQLLGKTPDGRTDYSLRRYTEMVEDGKFRFSGLPPGRYHLSVLPSGFPTAPSETGGAELDNVGAGTRDVVIRLPAGRTISGRIEDELGRPIEGQGYLYVAPTGTSPGATGTVVVMPVGDGTFRTPPLDDSTTYDIHATGFSGHRSGWARKVFPGTEDTVIVLETAGTISGRVLGPDGKPVATGVGVLARVIGVDSGEKGGMSFTHTGPDGTFTLEGLGEFDYYVRAGGADSGYMVGPRVRDLRAGAVDVELRVLEGVSLTARLLDADGIPVRTHLVIGREAEREPQLSSSASVEGDDGTFTLRGLAPGPIRITAYIGDRYVYFGELTAPGKDLEIRMPKPDED